MAKKKIIYCDTHDDVVSSGQCSECAKNICYNCTVDLFGKSFCGITCAAAFLGRNLFKGIFLLLVLLVRTLLSPFRYLAESPPRTGVSVVLGSGLLICLISIWRLNVRLTELKTAAAETQPERPFVEAPLITQPAGGTVHKSTVTIEGEAEENRIITLMIDGSVISAVLPEEGRFTFRDIELDRGDNRLEVRAVHPDNGVTSLQTITLTYAAEPPPAETAVSAPTAPALPGPVTAADFRRGSRERRQAALTFDGGADNNAADDILDALKEAGIHSTFFLTGQFIRSFPETVKRIAAEGHEAGNHTWSHPHLTSYAENRRQTTLPGVSKALLRDELEKTARLYREITGTNMAPLWRAPYGEYNDEILRWAASLGYRHTGWTVGRGWDNSMDTLDWVADTASSLYHSADQIVGKVVNYGNGSEEGANGVIVLMHLGTNRTSDFPHKKLGEMIRGLQDRDITLVTVSRLMEQERHD
ncbi:polysaccharide deacetylase family protein [bacterium]|nr:polysaccharide deacetylase family protein [bacterium]